MKYAITYNNNSYVLIQNDNSLIYITGNSSSRTEINNLIDKMNLNPNYDLDSVLTIYYIYMFVMIVFSIFVMWKLFEKAGYKGWYSIIPIYNIYILTKIAFGKGIYMLLMLIPLVNICFIIALCYKLPKAFGKSNGFAICNLFLSFFTMQILAFDNSKYINN